MTAKLFIGLISGTSMDAVDCALVDFEHTEPRLVDFYNLAIPEKLKSEILDLCGDGANQIHLAGEVDVKLGKLFARAVLDILENNRLQASDITAIGSHGQTIRHNPRSFSSGDSTPFTLQIGDPNTICEITGITTVADFRRRDMAAGGQGAPLVPAFHREIFGSNEENRIILNIGGISNITVIPAGAGSGVKAYDTGPGNVLMDTFIHEHQGKDYDENGLWAASGTASPALLSELLAEDYYRMAPPKSTGRELFNASWLRRKLASLQEKLDPKDIQATLLELTLLTVCDAILGELPAGEVIICGGGARNGELMKGLAEKLPTFHVRASSDIGFNSDGVEAAAFAWMAKKTLLRELIDMRDITGAAHPNVMGGIYYP